MTDHKELWIDTWDEAYGEALNGGLSDKAAQLVADSVTDFRYRERIAQAEAAGIKEEG